MQPAVQFLQVSVSWSKYSPMEQSVLIQVSLTTLNLSLHAEQVVPESQVLQFAIHAVQATSVSFQYFAAPQSAQSVAEVQFKQLAAQAVQTLAVSSQKVPRVHAVQSVALVQASQLAMQAVQTLAVSSQKNLSVQVVQSVASVHT